MAEDANASDEKAEIDCTHDDLITFISARKREEYARQTDSSESGAKTKKFVEETNLNSQALAWLKSIMKKTDKKDGDVKALDIIRSLRHGLDIVENEIKGQSTADMFDGIPE